MLNTWQENYEYCETQLLTCLYKEHLVYLQKFFANIQAYGFDPDLLKYDKFSMYTNTFDNLPHLSFGSTSIGNFENIWLDIIILDEKATFRHMYNGWWGQHKAPKCIEEKTLNLVTDRDWCWLRDTLNEIVASSENSKLV